MGSGASRKQTEVSTKVSREPSIANLQEFPGGKLNIYYGSQTGTAARFARMLAKEGKELGINNIVPMLPPYFSFLTTR